MALAIAAVPSAFVPIRLPWIVAPPASIRSPVLALAEIRLPAPGSVPPTVAPVAPVCRKTPYRPLATGDAPAGSVPMRLPRIVAPVEAPDTISPSKVLPEITLRCAAEVPPTTAPATPASDTPKLLPAAVPSAARPIQLPWIVTGPAVTCTPVLAPNPLTMKPRSTLPAPASRTPFPLREPVVALSWTTGSRVHPGCACASSTTGVVICGSAVAGEIVATPPEVRSSPARSPPAAKPSEPPAPVVPFGIMNTTCSMPAVRPACARLTSSPSAFALVIACRSEPRPVSLTLTTVEKLKPKSTPVASPVPVDTRANACAMPEGPAENEPSASENAAPAAPLPASAADGEVPPTWSRTGCTVPLLASVRKVDTGRCVPDTNPVRDDETLPLVTRTANSPAPAPGKLYAPSASVLVACEKVATPFDTV